jgi:hypothetical protein
LIRAARLKWQSLLDETSSGKRKAENYLIKHFPFSAFRFPFPNLLIDKIVKQNSGCFDGAVADNYRIESRLASSGFGGRTQQSISARRFGGSYVSAFVKRNQHRDLSGCPHLFGNRRIRGFR